MEIEELKELEEALPRLKECELEKVLRLVQGEDRSRPPESVLEFDQRNKKRNCGVTGKGGAKWTMAAASLHNDVLF